MAKYAVPTAALSALYSVWRSFYPSDDVIAIKSVDEAVNCLNDNINAPQALDYISKLKSEPSVVSRLSTHSVGMLAGVGSELVQHVPTARCKRYDDDYVFEKALRQFHLGDEWNDAVAWLNRVACSEDDLSWGEEWLVRRPSQIESLHRLVEMLYNKTKERFSPSSISPEIVDFLYSIYTTFEDSEEEIAFLGLRTLSNVALNGPEYAKRIFETEWLQLLSKLVKHGKSLDVRLVSHKVCQNALHSLNVLPYCLPADVYELHRSPTEPLIDIVMVHGLRGSVFYTWRQKDNKKDVISSCWPKDWLPIDIREPLRILGIDYPSELISFSGKGISLQQRADTFRSQLTDAGLGSRPIVFICHSMGGLLIKRLLLDCHEFAEKTVGILFIATPHRGSPIADWGYRILRPSEDVRFLHEKNELNMRLNQEFSSTVGEKIPVFASIVETKESNLIGTAKGIIVPTESAVFGKGVLYHIEEVHHNVCKPSERSSPSYSVILNFLRDSLFEAKKMIKIDEKVKKTDATPSTAAEPPPIRGPKQ